MEQFNSGGSSELITEQLKVSLTHIRQLIELSEGNRDAKITTLTNRALRVIDAHELLHRQMSLVSEPVSVGSVMYDVAHQLFPYAQQYNCDIAIDSSGKHGAVMADKKTLQLLLELVTQVVIAAPAPDSKRRIVLGTHRVGDSVIAGVFRDATEGLRLAPRQSNGRSSGAWQPDASLGLAEQLAIRLDSVLKPYRHNRLPGIGAQLVQSSQLRLV